GFPISLASELIHVIAHLARVRLEPRRAGLFVRGILRVEKCLERRLRVDDDLLAAWKLNDQIRPEAPVVALQRRLLVEVAAAQHARDLDDAAQLHLSPAPSDRWRAQRS